MQRCKSKSRSILAVPSHCTGCGACVYACPRCAIEMLPNEDGFLLPTVSRSKCSNCGKCATICPVQNPVASHSPIACVAARAEKIETRAKSSSGGVFPVIAKKIIDEGGVVYGATMDFPSCSVHHVRIDDIPGLARILGSKYVQSDISRVLGDIVADLKYGREVLFVGTPCQVAAITSLVKPREHLTTIALVCHGVTSHSHFQMYCDEIFGPQLRGTISSFTFRDKRYGWKGIGPTWCFTGSSEEVHRPGDPFCEAYLRNMISRPSCHHCPFRRFNSNSDIMLGDFWGGESLFPCWNDETGISAVIIQTQHGQCILNSLTGKGLSTQPVTLQMITNDNPAIGEDPHVNRAKWIFKSLRGRVQFSRAVRIASAIDYALSLPQHLKVKELRNRWKRMTS